MTAELSEANPSLQTRSTSSGEQPVSRPYYLALVHKIEQVAEEVGREHLDCEGGACPVEFGARGEAYLDSMGAG